MNSNLNMGQSLNDLTQMVGRLIDVQRSLGEEFLKLVGSSGDTVTGPLRTTLGSATLPKLSIPSLTGSCCDIPEPCWMPRCLGEIDCQVCPGAAATIRV